MSIYRSLNQHGSLVTHLTHDVRQTHCLVSFYQTHRCLHRYQHACSPDASTTTAQHTMSGRLTGWLASIRHIAVSIAISTPVLPMPALQQRNVSKLTTNVLQTATKTSNETRLHGSRECNAKWPVPKFQFQSVLWD